jgi:hypothetical protein
MTTINPLRGTHAPDLVPVQGGTASALAGKAFPSSSCSL